MNDVSFEEAFRRLETIVSTLESGRGELEESLAQYEEGIRLLRRCRQILDGAERRVEILKGVDENGAPILELADENALRSQNDVAGRQTPPATAAKSGVRATAKAQKSANSVNPAETAKPANPANLTGTANLASWEKTANPANPVNLANPANSAGTAPPPARSSRTSTPRRTSARTVEKEPPKRPERPEPPRGRSFFDDAPPF